MQDPYKPSPVAVTILRSILSPALRAMWRPRIEGAEHLPQGPCFIYGNHSNYLDPFTTNYFLGRDLSAGIMTFEFLRKGLFARLMQDIGILPTRPDRMEPHLIREVYRLLDAGRRVLIYPEAGRRWDGRPVPWEPTITKLFARGNVPVYPVIVEGSYVAWPRWAKYPRPARVVVRFLPPVHIRKGTPLPEALDRLQMPLQFDEDRPPDHVKPKWAWKPALGIETILYRNPSTGVRGDVYTPDGRRVLTRSGTKAWRMLPDSSLQDESTGEIHTVGDFYALIRAQPPERDAGGAYLQSRADLLVEDPDDHAMKKVGSVDASLFDDAIRISGAAVSMRIPLEEIHSFAVQRNWKLQLGLDAGLHQLNFTSGGSPLEWEDVIVRLRNLGAGMGKRRVNRLNGA